MNYRYLPVFGLYMMLFLFMTVPVSHAHRVIIFAWIEDGTVHTVSKFPGGNKVVDSTVVVYDGQGNRLLTGKTDARGNFSFPVPEPTELKIVLEAGAGHQGEWTLSEKEIAAALDETDRTSPAAETNAAGKPVANKNTPSDQTPDVSTDTAKDAAISAKQIETIVERSVDKKLQPIMNLLADMHDPGPSWTDIFGGIGYILGLFGVAALVATRKRKA